MISMAKFPRCAKRLEFQRANLTEAGMTEYWAAVCLADQFTNHELSEHGGINFADKSVDNGRKLLGIFEKLLLEREQRRVAHVGFSHDGLRAMFGARGVKTSNLGGEGDYWTVGETLFPGHIKRDGGMTELYSQILRISKKERKRLATANLRRLPLDWLSDAPAHAAKLPPSLKDSAA